MKGSGITKIQPTTLVREKTYESLRDAIVTGQLAPGQRLVERELCETMGVSRTSIREALRRLETECLATLIPHRGLTVAILSRKETIEIYEVRGQLEAILYYRFTEVATYKEIAQLREIYNNLPGVPSGSEDFETQTATMIQRIWVMNTAIDHVMRIVNHQVINNILNQLRARISVLRARAVSTDGRLKTAKGEVADLLLAIERRRPTEAAKIIKNFINNARNAALKKLNEPR